MRSRDYRAEYRRRVERALSRGLTRSQARGHAKAGEAPLRKPRDVEYARARLEAALRILRAKGNAQQAATEAKVSPERFRRFLRDEALASRSKRSWVITDNRNRTTPAITRAGRITVSVEGWDVSSLIGQHLSAVWYLIDKNDPSRLAPFVGASFRDTSGKTHFFETDPNALYRLAAMGGDGFEDVYRIANPT
jgi:hypothetical protein